MDNTNAGVMENGNGDGERCEELENDLPDNPIDESTQTTHLLPMDEISDDTSPPTPRFLQDQGSYRYMPWVPMPVRRVAKAAAEWAKGPSPPQIHKIQPLFPHIRGAPIRLLETYAPKKSQKITLLVGFYFCWIFLFAMVLHQGTVVTEIEGFGAPSEIGCGNTYWVAGNDCGLNGNECRPFSGSEFAFRCPGNCLNYMLQNPRAVGAQELNLRPLVIGGPESDNGTAVYRSDSFICGAAIHAGIIDSTDGGCGVVSLIGARSDYQGSNRNGIDSAGFDSTFPSSFTFRQGTSCKAKDPRWPLFYVSLTFTVLLSLFTTSPEVFFSSIFTSVFAHVGLASDPPWHNSMSGLISNILGKFLPAAFCAVVIFQYMGVRRALSGLTAQIEKTVLWLGACWFGALSNYTLDWIPIQRLTKSDLDRQPGAKLALAIIIIILATIVVKQVFYFRREGRLIRYLGIYGTFLALILIGVLLPGLNLRIHHYVLGLLLLPGTSMQTRPALLYQGFLVGLFINGIARWGFDSVLETSEALIGDGPHNTLLPVITTPAIVLGKNVSTISFSWSPPPNPYDGISVLVNDVERFRGYTDEGFESDRNRFDWKKDSTVDEPEYFRFAYMEGSRSWDYTKAGTWNADGSWTKMESGPSRVKGRSLDGEQLVQH
jgi:hypothetical protein